MTCWIGGLNGNLIALIAPPPPSAAELKHQEDEANSTLKKIVIGAVALYLCMLNAFCLLKNHTNRLKAPFAIDAIKKMI